LKSLPIAEVAERMDRTRAAVVGLLYRGVKKLRELLQDQESPEFMIDDSAGRTTSREDRLNEVLLVYVESAQEGRLRTAGV